MQPWVYDSAIVLIILGITYALYSEGFWGATLMFFNVLFSALIALNFYEPLAGLLAKNVSAMGSFADLLCLGGLFCVVLVLLRTITGYLAPSNLRLPSLIDQLGRLVAGLAAATLLVAFLLVMLHTAPAHKKLLGTIDANRAPPFKWAFDRRFLDFFRHTTDATFPSYSNGTAKVFDPNGDWLAVHEQYRPFPKQ